MLKFCQQTESLSLDVTSYSGYQSTASFQVQHSPSKSQPEANRNIMIASLFALILIPVLHFDWTASFQICSHNFPIGAVLKKRANHVGLANHASARRNKISATRKHLKMTNDDDMSSITIGATGVLFNVVCGYSLYVLKTTSCGLPPGPYGLLGALEGISYLGVVGIVIWSAITKVNLLCNLFQNFKRCCICGYSIYCMICAKG